MIDQLAGVPEDPSLNRIIDSIHQQAVGTQFADAVPDMVPDGKMVIHDDGAGDEGLSFKTAEGNIVTLSENSYANALTGTVVQVVHVDGFAKVTGANDLPMDNSTPQVTEGTEIMTLAITPRSATNKLKVTVVAYVGADVGNGAGVAVALFNTNFHSTNAIMTGYTHTGNQTSVNSLDCVTFVAYVTAAVTSASIFKVRMGAGTTNVYFNSDLGTDYFNGTFGSSITIEEIKV